MKFFGRSKGKDDAKMDPGSAVERETPLLPHRDTDVGVMEPPHLGPHPPTPPAPAPTPVPAPAPTQKAKSKKAPKIITSDPESPAPRAAPAPTIITSPPPPQPQQVDTTPAPAPLAHPNPEPTTDYRNADAESDDGDDDTMWIKTKIPNLKSKRRWNKFKNNVIDCDCLSGVTMGSLGAYFSTVGAQLGALPAWAKMAAAGSAAVVVLAIVALTATPLSAGSKSSYNVAFIGNSNIFLNDLPRLVESLSEGSIFQDSCLHAGGSMLKIVRTGNGMYNRWTTQNALMSDVQWLDQNNQRISMYDYGACSVPQLLLGYDYDLSYGNEQNNFYDDGNNPCFESNYYLDWTNSFNYSEPWDFVVLADQSKRMAFDEARYEAYLAFNYTYIPILNETGSIPIVLQPHAFWSSDVNMTGLDDVTNFTAHIYNGALKYQDFLTSGLKKKQKARLAPVGNAFLAVYQHDESMWNKLFLEDNIYPSPYGTYLYGLVVYGTIYGKLPRSSAAVVEDMGELWANARATQFGNNTGFPTSDEAQYLYNVAKRVAIHGHVPSMPDVSGSE